MAGKIKTEIELINHHHQKIFPSTFFGSLTEKVIEKEGIELSMLRIIAVDDDYLRRLHQEYLNDDTFTDVMTFEWDDEGREAEIYISVDRARVNAEKFGVSLKEEISRLIVHGLLHLKGMDDKTPSQRKKMHLKENELLKLVMQQERSGE